MITVLHTSIVELRDCDTVVLTVEPADGVYVGWKGADTIEGEESVMVMV